MGWFRRKFVLATLVTCSLSTLFAQPDTDIKGLAGNWVYRLGPNTLLALSLQTDSSNPARLRGNLLYPTNFNVNSTNDTELRFSNITNQSQRESIFSSNWQNGSLRLEEDAPSKKPEDRGVYLVRFVDATHMDFTLFLQLPLPPFKMERVADQPRLTDTWDSQRTYTLDDFMPDNAQMAHIVQADQADRKNMTSADDKALSTADEKRRTATAVLLREGKLHTAQDFDSASLVFQHGDMPADYLLAHAFAMVAVSKGRRGSVWISAATLDRYLQSIHQPQIFGTQFKTPGKEPTTQEPYDRSLVSDCLRGYMYVPNQVRQEEQRQQFDVQRGINSHLDHPRDLQPSPLHPPSN